MRQTSDSCHLGKMLLVQNTIKFLKVDLQKTKTQWCLHNNKYLRVKKTMMYMEFPKYMTSFFQKYLRYVFSVQRLRYFNFLDLLI